jgi:hypothetical protein
MHQKPSTRIYSKSALASLAVLAGIAVGLIISQLRAAWVHAETTDFSVFYDSARAMLAGRDLYLTTAKFPNLNPPHFVIAFAALAYLPMRQALALWTAINIGCAVLGVRLLFRDLDIQWNAFNVLVVIVVSGLSVGVLVALEAGQVTGIVMLLMTTAWSLSRRNRWVMCGVVLGVIISVKPFFVFLLLIPVLHRQYRALLAAGGSISVALLGTLIFCGPQSLARWLETGRLINWFQHPANASLLGLLARAGAPSWPWWGVLSTLAVLATVGLTVGRHSIDTEWAAYALLSILVCPLGWDYYVPTVAGPLVAVARRHGRIVFAGTGFIWPIPLAVALVPTSTWSLASVGSLQTYSLLALWMGVVTAREVRCAVKPPFGRC